MSAPRARAAVAAACLVAALAAGSCGSEGGATEEPEGTRIDLVVGDIVPSTGSLAGLGVSAQKAAQLAVEEINDAIAEADLDHTVEIVHQDAADRGARAATKLLLNDGAGCIVGPWSRRSLAAVAREPGVLGAALLVSPRAPVREIARASRGTVVGLPPLGPERALSSESDDHDRDPSASFARLYFSTDPPIGPARSSDARQFDAVMLCYLAAVAAGDDAGPRLIDHLGRPEPRAHAFSWLRLADAIRALEQGDQITYSGLTVRMGVLPAGDG